MKKIIPIVLVLILALSFAGCNNGSTYNSIEGNTQKIEETKQQETERVDVYKFGELADTVKVDDTTVTFIDSFGKEVTTSKNPKKVIVLYNSFADLWYNSGGDIIARLDSQENMPEAYLDKETVGSVTSFNIEKIMSMEPDLVILKGDDHLDSIEILKQSGIDCLSMEYDGFEAYLYTLKVFTSITNREDLYEKNGTDLLKEINSIITKVSNEEAPEVLLMFASSKSISVRLSTTSTGQMLEHLGAKNIAMEDNISEADRQIFSMEKILEKNPDFIFVQTMGDLDKVEERLKADVENNPAWNSLDAVKNGRYIVLDKSLYHFKANTRYAEAYENLAKSLYPDLFEGKK